LPDAKKTMDITQSENIFIYAVCGRSSSTALQRILNSSDEIVVLGEHRLAIEKLVDSYYYLGNIDWETQHKELIKLQECFQNKSHTSFYANAANDIRPVRAEIQKAIINLLQPLSGYTRMGYKEIGTIDRSSLMKIADFFPNSHFIFLFRNPLQQWGSVGFLKSFWDYSKQIDSFLSEYNRIADIYLNAPLKKAFFVEDISLRDEQKVKQIIQKVNLHNFDRSLIGKTISTTNKHKPSLLEKAKIFTSPAWQKYRSMQKRDFTTNFIET
jgi:hypothetical protein